MVQLGRRLTRCRSISTVQKSFHVERLVAAQHVINRARQLVSQNRQGFALAMHFLQAGQIGLPWGIVSKEKNRRFREGPFQMRIADLGADGTVNLAGGLFLGLHQTAVGNEILNRREARNVVDFIQKHQGQNLADARKRIQQMKCIRIVQLGMTQDFQLDLVQQTIVEINPFQVKGDVGSLLTKCPSPVVAPGFYLFLSWRSCRYRSSYDKRFKGPCLGCGNVRLKLCIWRPVDLALASATQKRKYLEVAGVFVRWC